MAEKTTTVKPAVKEETAVKAVAPEKKEEVKAEVKKEEKAPAAKKETKTAAKKSTAKKTTTKSTASKTTAKAEEKPAAKKSSKKTAGPVVHLQFGGKSYSMEDLQKIANDVWKYDLHNEEDYTSLELYVKPEESVAYYVFNGDIAGSFFI